SHRVAESTEEEGIFRHGVQFRHKHPGQETLPHLRQDLRVRLGSDKAGNQLAICFDFAFPGAERIDHDEPDTMPGEEAYDAERISRVSLDLAVEIGESAIARPWNAEIPER